MTRKCHVQDRALVAGEAYFSVIIEDGDGHRRIDISDKAWEGPDKRCIGWWKRRMPISDQKKLVPTPMETLVELVSEMADDPSRAKMRYLLAIWLVRRKALKVVQADTSGVLAVSTDGGDVIEVSEVAIHPKEADSLGEQLNEWLFTEVEEELED
ncbi:MAG: hypothetical protein AAF664_18980 [Planctomycetota bacterium]